VVETHQRRVVFPGRQQAIVGVQLGLNLGAQRLLASSTPMTLTRQKVPIVLPSSTVAVEAGRRVAESQPEQYAGAQQRGAKEKVISINRGSSYQGDKSIPARLNQT
jgi:hypothetical protein